jgi:peptidoglycan-associated lipoprotein
MTRHALLAATLVVLALAAPGCAKQPAMSAASAPSPTAPATVSVAPPATASAPKTSEPTRPAASQPDSPVRATAPRSAPSEFAAVAEVRDIHFDYDKYEIRPADREILDANGRWLKDHAGHLVLIEGHADERGTPEYNLTLGERRGKATLNYLGAQGVAAARMTVISYGETRPACTESTEACWAKNRRAHFLVKAN